METKDVEISARALNVCGTGPKEGLWNRHGEKWTVTLVCNMELKAYMS